MYDINLKILPEFFVNFQFFFYIKKNKTRLTQKKNTTFNIICPRPSDTAIKLIIDLRCVAPIGGKLKIQKRDEFTT